MTNWRVGHALLFLAVCAGILLAAAPAARADSDVRIVRLSYVSGDVQMDRGTGQGFEAAVMNMPVTRGSRVVTGDDGYAEVEFEDGSTARLAPGTELNVQELSLRGDGGRVSMIEVQQGTAYFDVRATDADDFRVTVAGHDLQISRHARFRISGEQDTVRVAVFDGTLVVPTGDGRVEVGKNQTLSLDLSDPSRYEVVRNVSEEAYDQWDRDRADYRANYQASSSAGNSYAGGYDSSYSYGVSDMNYYGSYTYISGWGNVWQPYFVGAGWNPWMDGAWVWYPGIGYVWVSAYPWGWTPYRYGGWYFIGGHGWCWRADRHWQHWSPVAAVHNPPPNFRPPVVPVSGGPHVVPVGHGPVTLYPNPDDRDWRGPRRPVDPGAPGGKVRLSEKVPQHPVTPVPMRPRIPDEGVPAPVVAQPVTPSAPATGGGAGSFKGGEPVRPAPIPVRVSPDEHIALPATGAPSQPAGPSPAAGAGAGTYKPQPVRPVTPIPMRSSDEGTVTPPPASPVAPAAPPHSRWQSDDGGSSRGSGGSHVSTPAPPAAPAPPPVYTPPAAQSSGGGAGSGHSSGGSGGGYHPSPPPSPPPSSPRSSGYSGGGYSGGGGGSSSGSSHSSGGGASSSGGSHSSGGSSSGGSHSSGSSHSSSSSGSKSPK